MDKKDRIIELKEDIGIAKKASGFCSVLLLGSIFLAIWIHSIFFQLLFNALFFWIFRWCCEKIVEDYEIELKGLK